MPPNPSARLLVLFGATGDLALRMLWPSLYSLQAEGFPNVVVLVGSFG